MAINEYLKECGETLYRVRVVRKSTDKPGVVIQKSAANLKTLSDAKKVEQRLNREAERELAQKEIKDTLWGVLANEWAEAHERRDVVKTLTKGSVIDYLSLLRTSTSHWQCKSANEIDKAEVLRRFCENIGIPSVNFHALRASFATMLLRDQIAPVIVMKICSWKDLKIMGRYVRLAGVDVQDSTGHLKLLPKAEVMGRVVEFLK